VGRRCGTTGWTLVKGWGRGASLKVSHLRPGLKPGQVRTNIIIDRETSEFEKRKWQAEMKLKELKMKNGKRNGNYFPEVIQVFFPDALL